MSDRLKLSDLKADPEADEVAKELILKDQLDEKIRKLERSTAELQAQIAQEKQAQAAPKKSSAKKIGARKEGSFKAISTAPSINKTPIGPSMVPVPYCTTRDLSSSIDTARTVNFNGCPAYVLDSSKQPRCTGDEPGTGKGVKSGTVSGEVKPVAGSSTVRIEGKKIVRAGDACTMNGGNNPGIYVVSLSASPLPPKATSTSSSTPAEWVKKDGDSFWESFFDETIFNIRAAGKHPVEGSKGAAKGVANSIPETAEMVLMGAAEQQAIELSEAAAIQTMLGNTKMAQALRKAASSSRTSGAQVELPKFELRNSAQKGGSAIVAIGQIFIAGIGLAKGGLGATGKLLRSSKREVSAIRDVTVAESLNLDSVGDGVKILRNSDTARDAAALELLERKWGKGRMDVGLALKRADPSLNDLLTDGEYLSIRCYTDFLYEEINPALRSGNIDEWKAMIQQAEKGLAKLTANGYKFKGIVRRDAEFTKEQIERLFPKNGIFQDQAFLSSTKKMDGEFSGNTKIEIKSSNGVDVKSISRHATEEEVLFPPGTKFKVISKEIDQKNGTNVIKLEEIP